ncbi:hypothetical protein RA19_09170 [Leisingera sp. ANG-M1]|uniref:DUF1127 domain-containing protein n=1 Tax=Leisingera sp. ANG-M1 TaxID=1577895 RepID=UPI00057F0F19|nr:DUF1127 domain-containing protein [Leisingera sp. ANG-M1]KIC10894.1 hypothetical protein RA19_09170 [Leisingera sp. ANG-M1]
MQMTRTNSAGVHEASLAAAWLSGLWQRPVNALRRLADHERTLLALAELSDDQLKDIGLNPRDLSADLKTAAHRR